MHPALLLAPLWTAQVDPLTTALGYVHVQVERALGPDWSIYAGPHMRLFDSLLADDEEDFVGFGVELGLRWYFSGTAPSGGWVLVRGVGAHLTAKTPMGDETALGGYVSGLGGYTWIFDDRWVLSAGGGVQYLQYRVADLGPEGIFPALHTTFGVAF